MRTAESRSRDTDPRLAGGPEPPGKTGGCETEGEALRRGLPFRTPGTLCAVFFPQHPVNRIGSPKFSPCISRILLAYVGGPTQLIETRAGKKRAPPPLRINSACATFGPARR